MTEVGSQGSEVTRQRKAGTKPMNKKIMFLAPCCLLFAPCFPAEAQQPKIPKIGFLGVRPDAANYSAKSSCSS